jgi:ABC-type multidrug transport system permease subunit
MKNTVKLVGHELHRLIRYMILPVSLATSLIWVIILLFLSAEEALVMAPIFIFTDVALMSVILIGASHHLEKQEGTIRSMLMMPVSIGEILAAKTAASMVLALESVVVTVLGLYFIHGIRVDAVLLLLYVVVASLAHAGIGFTLSLLSRDFTSMLGLLMGYMFAFAIPSMLYAFKLIPQSFEWILWISPSHAASTLISSAVSGSLTFFKVAGALVYLFAVFAVSFRFAVYPKFRNQAVRG